MILLDFLGRESLSDALNTNVKICLGSQGVTRDEWLPAKAAESFKKQHVGLSPVPCISLVLSRARSNLGGHQNSF